MKQELKALYQTLQMMISPSAVALYFDLSPFALGVLAQSFPIFNCKIIEGTARELRLVSWEYSKGEGFKSSKIGFTHVSGKRKVDKPLQTGTFRPLGLSTNHVYS